MSGFLANWSVRTFIASCVFCSDVAVFLCMTLQQQGTIILELERHQLTSCEIEEIEYFVEKLGSSATSLSTVNS